MSVIDIKIPSPGESIAEVQIATWFVNTGDYVEKNQEIAELESDKATLTLIANDSGEITILAQDGETVDVGSVACTIDTSVKATKKPDSPVTIEKTKEAASAKPQEEIVIEETGSDIKITPVAKEVLKEKGISTQEFLSKLQRITSKDVDTVLAYSVNNEQPASTSLSKERESETKKMSPLRKKLGQRLVQVKNQTAMLTTFNEVNMKAVIDLRNKHKAAFQEKFGVKLGFMSFFTKAASIALQYHPNINAMIDDDEIVSFNYTDIGIAVQTPKGLMVPIVRDVDKKTLAETELGIAEMATKARNAKISLDEMSGGTFTITNGGVFGSLLSTPILNPPQSGILGMHNIVERPIAENGEVVIRPMMYVALSYDHRLVDGRDSVGFLVRLKELIENPERMLLNGIDPTEKLILA
ncbi:MAG: 2-oxoglutarate dehydrogenase complex dihydrolipoyllysine-residue succinyltransferase [Salinivirgaceae bacterium]|jgi:2-oxoglutarate dehydrogenase E2 component (dihydrolipoamide succinyltransferase)|nr:2-oxoglutarate dehydrogenase complex dihydrolipoyllysine-residue succinyltransferase [Salinivirgaceae bacterium]